MSNTDILIPASDSDFYSFKAILTHECGHASYALRIGGPYIKVHHLGIAPSDDSVVKWQGVCSVMPDHLLGLTSLGLMSGSQVVDLLLGCAMLAGPYCHCLRYTNSSDLFFAALEKRLSPEQLDKLGWTKDFGDFFSLCEKFESEGVRMLTMVSSQFEEDMCIVFKDAVKMSGVLYAGFGENAFTMPFPQH